MKTLKEVLNIINGSKSYEFEYNEVGRSTVLVITDYYTSKSVKLDLSLLNEEMLEALQIDEEIEEGEDF